MKNIIYTLLVAIVAASTLTSCLGDDENEVILYDDAAITAVTLGTLNRSLPTKTFDGHDSTAVSKIDGSSFHFNIDQSKKEIYNTDSLPYGTDISKIVCTIATKNGGTVVIKSMTSDSVKYHSPTDSVDFTQQRTFFVYSNSGKNMAEYKMSVRLHKQLPDQFEWKRTAIGGIFAAATSLKAIELNGKIYVIGSDGATGFIASTSIDDGESWTMATPDINTTLPYDLPQNITSAKGMLFAIINGNLMATADGNHWIDKGATSAKRIIGSDGEHLFAFDENGNIISSDNAGETWNLDIIDDEKAMLPVRDITMVRQQLKSNSDMYRLVMMGNRDESVYANDANAVVWSRLFDTSGDASYPWMFYRQASTVSYQAPRLRNMTMMNYNNRLIAVGGMPIGACQTPAFEAIYESVDGGLTWKESSLLTLPTDFVNVANTFCAIADSRHFIWLINAESGEIWRARLSQLAWEEEQTVFRTKRR